MRYVLFILMYLYSINSHCSHHDDQIYTHKLSSPYVFKSSLKNLGYSRLDIIKLKKFLEYNPYSKKEFIYGKDIDLPFDIEFTEELDSQRSILIHSKAPLGRGAQRFVFPVLSYNNNELLVELSNFSKLEGKILLQTKGLRGLPDYYKIRINKKSDEDSHLMLLQPYYPIRLMDITKENTIAKLNRTSLSDEDKFNLALDLLWGLKNLHDTGFVHRDIHPNNIMIGRTKASVFGVLIDFGISIPRNHQKMPANNLGVPPYNSPRIWKTAIEVGCRHLKSDDVWSLGLSLFYLKMEKEASWTAKLGSAMNLTKEQVNDDPDIQQLKSLRDDPLSVVIVNLLQVDPKEAWTTEQAINYLESFLE